MKFLSENKEINYNQRLRNVSTNRRDGSLLRASAPLALLVITAHDGVLPLSRLFCSSLKGVPNVLATQSFEGVCY